MKNENAGGDSIVVRIDVSLKALIPQYLKNRRSDVQNILAALEDENFRAIDLLGHSMKGSGGGYGFDLISEIGGAIELSAKNKSAVGVRKALADLEQYLDRVKVCYE